jgi:hypothetical protein
MTDMEQDRIITKVRETLRGAPEAVPDQRAVARVLSTVWSAPQPSAWRRLADGWRMTSLSGLAASGLAAAALLIGFVSRGAVSTKDAPTPLAASGAPTGEYPTQLATYDANTLEALRVPTQFVFEHTEASEVSLVGDFNNWEVGETKLVKLSNGLWTTTVPLAPGRHVYSYVIDGTLLVADPRAPKSGDADYGREGSVVMVFAR